MVSDFELSLSYALQLEGLKVKDKQREAIQAVYYGKDMLGMAKLPVPSLQADVGGSQVVSIAINEAHCVSQCP